jgi:hypothetical protein
MTKILYPPERQYVYLGETVFLAGSIEMGTADNWQDKAEKMLDRFVDVIYNPRRKDWDPNWEQSFDNPKFFEQVNWELDYIEVADHVIFYFDPNTKSPITLMELGFCAARSPDNAMLFVLMGFGEREM